MDQRGEDFESSSNTKTNVTKGAEKVNEKNGVICLVSMFSSWVMVVKLSKRVHFLQICAELSKKSKPIKAIYIFAFESYRKKTPWGY